MFFLVTGSPGASKTLYVIHNLKEVTDRKIYYHNINELKLDWTPLENPKDWANEVEDNSIVVIDEVQKIFGQRDFKKAKPAGVEALETHRHRGLDVYFITQHPTMLDAHARRLVNTHIHLKRNFGAKFSAKYICNETTDPADKRALKQCEKGIFNHPKQSFGLYKSAEVHTHKFKMPKIIYVGIAAIFALIYVGNLAYNVLFDENKTNEIQNAVTNQNAELAAKNPIEKVNQTFKNFGKGKEDKQIVAKDFIPEIPGIPGSAPVYKSVWKPKTFPRLFCISSETKCLCHTQQSTPYNIEEDTCRYLSENGTFDFTKPDKYSRRNTFNNNNLAANHSNKGKRKSTFPNQQLYNQRQKHDNFKYSYMYDSPIGKRFN